MTYDIKDVSLAPEGKLRIEWADRHMPVLHAIRGRFLKEKPFDGLKMSACLHVTAETANLMRVFKDGGADVMLCASNPLSTQDDVAAALVKEFGIPVFAVHGEDRERYYAHLRAALDHGPQLTMDDGADLIHLVHTEYQALAQNILASMEETTTGVIRLRALEREGKLLVPVVAVNDAKTKNMFDNRYGTGQSTIDGIIRATNILLAGKAFVIAGYGWCGKGLASRARGMGARVVVTEVDAIAALEAVMDGFEVAPMIEAAPLGDIFCTVTGNIHVIRKEHFEIMKDGAVVCNSGHFDVEVDLKALAAMALGAPRVVRTSMEEYVLANGKKVYILAEGRLVNLASAEGHPPSVMDMSFATQALSAEYATVQGKKLERRVYLPPEKLQQWIAEAKLQSMRIDIDQLTEEQKKYLSSWEFGT